ncbi:hypothetical protein HPB47_017480 [Ixodes persulcatus]|uniref:Uncharacterized protein n=1 Tax=Ixodes persulcatus TaxID=34615 RepID=A0AC60QQ81_IXOPE|nr:hypothetical protein HPB47_017480 [Ixodes persulcatus]
MSYAMPDYLSSLPEPERQRYRDKLCVDGVAFDDPYAVNKACWTSDVKLLPPKSTAHVVVYLVFSPSQFTADTVAYKSLEAYDYFESVSALPAGSAVCGSAEVEPPTSAWPMLCARTPWERNPGGLDQATLSLHITRVSVYRLKKKHTYGQVQLGMTLPNVDSCDFVIYASVDDAIETINVPWLGCSPDGGKVTGAREPAACCKAVEKDGDAYRLKKKLQWYSVINGPYHDSFTSLCMFASPASGHCHFTRFGCAWTHHNPITKPG